MPSYIRTRTEFAVNSFTSANQMAPAVSTFADGGFVVVWGTSDPTQDGSDSAIKAQLFDSAGNKVGMEFLVNDDAPGFQFTASVSALDGGRFVVTWVTSSADGYGIKARLFDAFGAPIGGEFAVGTSALSGLFTPNVVKLANGGFVISWDSAGDVKAQIYDSTGLPVGAELRLNTNTTGSQGYGDIVGLADGGFVATWRTTDPVEDGSGDAVKAQVFSATGAKVGAEFLVNSQKADTQNSPSIAALDGGGFVITWFNADSAQDGSGSAIKAQLFNASGVRVGTELLVNSQTADSQTDPAVTATRDGGFTIAWTSRHTAQDGSGSAIKAQSFDKNGAKLGGELLVNTLAAGGQFGVDLATLADGRVVATWQSESGDIDGYALRGQILGTQPAAPQPNARPIIISNGGGTSIALEHDEGVMAITTVVASDDGEPNNLRYSIAPGEHANLFSIDAFTGVLRWTQPPEFDPNGTNFYTVTVNASDGQLIGSQTIQLSVNHVNHVTIVSDGGYEWAEIWADENQTAVTTVSAVDEDGAPLTYSITGGEDADLFTIDAQTGVLSFIAAPDYERPEDHWGDNFYEVEVTASDGTRSDSQFLGVYVNDVEEAPGFAIASDGGGDEAELHRPENSLAVTTVAVSGAAGPVTYEIVGGVSASRFDIDPQTGALSFREPPDFETDPYGPDAWWYDPYNDPFPYGVIVRASDGVSFDEQLIVIWVDDVDEAPVFGSFDGAGQVGMIISENDLDLGYVWASDPDRYSWVTYGLDGPDAAFFQVDPYSGAFSFIQSPDYEAWADADADNVYEVSVVAYSNMLSSSQSFSFTVVDLWENESPTIVSNGGGSSASVDMEERQTLVTTVVAVDDGGPNPIHYSITGGWAAGLFAIDSVTGELFFREAPDYEAPLEGSGNVYEVEVTADDGELWTSQLIQVRVTNVYEDVRFDSPSRAFLVDENRVTVGSVSALGEEGFPLHYSIMPSGDGAYFEINGDTGELTFWAAPDADIPGDPNWDNVYNLTVRVTDGTTSAYQSVSVTVNDLDEGVYFVSYDGAASVALTKGENVFWVGQVLAFDEDSDVTYSIGGGADAALFEVDPVTGELTFRYEARPDFEAPTDVDGDSVYEVVVQASEGFFSATQAFSVTIANNNEGVWITSNGGDWRGDVTIAENSSAVTTVTAYDPDGTVPIFQIVGGADADRFAIDAQSGALTFISAPDYEAWADSDHDNVYHVMVAANDGDFATAQDLFVTIAEVDEPVEIVSYGGADSVSLSILEAGYWRIGFVEAEDDGFSMSDPTAYRITGGADAALFTVDRYSGELRFDYDRAPDFENPSDADGDNVYEVVVTASSATSSDSQAFSVTLLNRNEGIWITSNNDSWPASVTVAENGRAVTIVTAEDPDRTVPTFSIAGGADADRFTIDAQTGALSFVDAPDFEAPADAGADNVYNVTVAASDGEETDLQELRVVVANADDPVEIVSYDGAANVTLTVAENGSAVGNVLAQDGDGGPVTYSIAGGADAAAFAIDPATGALRFVSEPDFESAADADGDNAYEVIVRASDGASWDEQRFSVEVAEADEAPEFVGYSGGTAQLTAVENSVQVADLLAHDPDAGSEPVHYLIVGGADRDLFRIDSATGRLTLINPAGLDFEAPTDIGRDNVYDVEVMAGSGGLGRIQAFAIRVVNANEPLTILSPASITVSEGEGTYVTRVAGYDIDGTFPTYSIVGGADSARFTLDAGSGVLRFVATPDFEAPTDFGGDNVYTVEVAATDGEFSTTQTMQITVRNVAERTVVTSYGGAENVTLSLPENGTAVATVQAVDPDGGRITYSLGGEDSALFAIDSETGALRFVGPPNFEAPADVDGNNSYLVTVVASDGTSTDTQAFRINVGNVDEAAAITSNGGGATAAVSVGENGLGVTKVVAADPEGAQVVYSIVGGADAARFTIDAATGALAFVAAPDFEAPADSGGNNVYDVVVAASDGGSVDTQALAVTVANVDEAPVIGSNGGGATASASVAENGRTVTTVAALDPDGTSAGYSIVGGADSARFTIDAQTGLLQFVAAPDWEAPADSNGDNVYSVIVQASDGSSSDQQTLSVSVLNQRDGANVTGTTGGDSISGTSTNPALRTTNSEDTVSGRDGHDTILGLGGDDILMGDAGNDVLNGGMGADRLTGGLGKDQFVYNSADESAVAAPDVITDFSRAQADKIALSGIDANSLLSGNQAFTFIGAAAFSGVAGQLRYSTSGGMTLVSGDVNGDGVADFQIELAGTLAPVASDFVL